MKSISLSLLLVLSGALPPAGAKDLRVLVSGIQGQEGKILCLLFADDEGFPAKAKKAAQSVQYPVTGELLTCTFEKVPPGRYAVTVVHDQNGNGEIDTAFGGAIKEPWGVSNNVRPAQRKPTFHEAVIYFTEDKVMFPEVKLK